MPIFGWSRAVNNLLNNPPDPDVLAIVRLAGSQAHRTAGGCTEGFVTRSGRLAGRQTGDHALGRLP